MARGGYINPIVCRGFASAFKRCFRLACSCPVVVACAIAGYGLAALPVEADIEQGLTADALVVKVNAVEEGEFVTRRLGMTMVDSRGKTRQRETVNYRKQFADGKRTVMFYLRPANIRDTGFLIWDYADVAVEDKQWIYLPALGKVRRVSAADRGDYFFGTDFTFEDMKLDGKLGTEDYEFTLLGRTTLEGVDYYQLQSLPRSEAIAEELGYSKVVSLVHPDNWIIMRSEFWDTEGRPLKTLQVADVRQIDGIWTRHQLSMRNHQSGHQTQFRFSAVDYSTPIDDGMFSKRALARGVRGE